MEVTLTTAGGGRRAFPVRLPWDGSPLPLPPASPLLGVDTEFDPETRALALVSVSDGSSSVLFAPDRWPAFLAAHPAAVWVMHYAACDWPLLREALPASQRADWVRAADEGRVRDTLILDQLLRLAVERLHLASSDADAEGGSGASPVPPRKLSAVAADMLGVSKDDADPYRMRFGELVGRDLADPAVDPGFFAYAARDPLLTVLTYREQCLVAREVMDRFLPASRARPGRTEVRPDAPDRWGHLSEVIQVQGALALHYVERLGIGIDQARLAETEAALRRRMADTEAYLVAYHPDVVPPRHGRRATVNAPGTLRRTGSGCLSLCGLQGKLQRVAERLRLPAGTVPMADGKRGGISTSAKAWAHLADRSPFLARWCGYVRDAKLCGFIEQVRGLDRVHPRYNVLVTTGRTSCHGPNLQQQPKGDWRRHFVPTPGYRLFVGDLAGAELCTFAAYCRWAYGESVMGDQLEAGRNVHAFFAAAILGVGYEEFLALKETDPKQFAELRQVAKPANFGLMGGMGADAFVRYANAPPYNLSLTEADAVRLIALWEATFPEGKLHRGPYPEHRCLARALGCPLAEVQDWMASRSAYFPRLVERVVAGQTATAKGEPYSPWTLAEVWRGLAGLCRDPGLKARLLEQKPSPALRDAVFRRDVATLTGRVVADVRYTDLRNFVFQGVAADVKQALWRLHRDGHRVCGFVHDEVLVEVADEAEGRRVAATVEATMREICGKGVPFTVEWHLADCWEKP